MTALWNRKSLNSQNPLSINKELSENFYKIRKIRKIKIDKLTHYELQSSQILLNFPLLINPARLENNK